MIAKARTKKTKNPEEEEKGEEEEEEGEDQPKEMAVGDPMPPSEKK